MQAAYVHYCDNETIHGLEFPSTPAVKELLPGSLVVADLASNIGTKPINWNAVDLAYGQKVSSNSSSTNSSSSNSTNSRSRERRVLNSNEH